MRKLYRKIMKNRLVKWKKVDKCQVGRQEKRICVVHILVLRLLIDYALSQKCKLYFLLVDFT